jgi:carbonic anhydrase
MTDRKHKSYDDTKSSNDDTKSSNDDTKSLKDDRKSSKDCTQFYQSPICLHHCSSIDIKKPICIKGKNYCAKYNCHKHVFEVTSRVIVKVNHNRYQLSEYHFHVPGEHVVNDRIYSAEVHYVFVQLDHCEKYLPKKYVCHNICHCCETKEHFENKCHDDNRNILVIARVINPTDKCSDLSNIQVEIPSCYYEYDGTLTTGNFAPVRWVVGDDPICFNICELRKIAKPARPIQPLDGRIILFSNY